LLTADRNDWENYREEFVAILVKYGYQDYLYREEEKWYKDSQESVERGEYVESLSN
jgi:hypothetical protein